MPSRFNKLVAGSILCLCLLINVDRCFAWGPDGHKIVALIAMARLTPEAAAEVKKLYDTDTLADWASWPDEIRQERPETSPWHFVDIPVSAATFDPARDGNGGANILDAIERNEKTLADRSAKKVARAEALSFITHLIGDVHQPLHCADRDHDKGGNLRLVYLLDQSKSLNLHSAWDSAILKTEMGRTSDAVFASSLNARISKEDVQKWSQGSLVDWINESHQLAVSVVYAGIPERGPLPRLDKTYVDRALQVINLQLSRGGVRLAMELNRILSSSNSVTGSETPTTQPLAATSQQ